MRIQAETQILLGAALSVAAVFYLAAPGKVSEPQDMPEALPEEGMRAISTSVDYFPGGAPNVGPGDRVDIQLTRNTEGGSFTIVILEDIPVVAMGKQKNSGVGWPFTEYAMIVEFDPNQARIIALARQTGRLSATPAEAPPCRSDVFTLDCWQIAVPPLDR